MCDESGPEEPPNSEFTVKTVTNNQLFATKTLQILFVACIINYNKGQNEVKYGEKVPIFQKINVPYIAHAGDGHGICS